MSARRPRLSSPLLLIAALAAACGSDADADATPGAADAPAATARADAPARLVVRERLLAWTPDTAPAPAPDVAAPDASSRAADPLSRTWDLGADQTAWRPTSGRAERAGGALVLRDDARVALEGPFGGDAIDADLHQWLLVRLRAPDELRVELQWAGAGEDFDRDRMHAQPVAASPETTTLRLRLDALRDIAHGATAAQGVARFRITFTAAPTEPATARPVEVALEEITLFSEYDVPAASSAPVMPLGRGGVFRRGVVTRAPSTLAAPIAPGPGERLSGWLAVAGRDAHATVVVRDEAGRATPTTLYVAGGTPWVPFALDLAPLAGTRTRILLEVTTRQQDVPAVVLLGGVLRLGPDASAGDSALLYVVDTLRADRLGAGGDAPPTAPALEALAASGATFTRCFATSNWTRPAVATILTGLLPSHHGNDDFADRVVDGAVPLAQVLADAGLLTASFVTNFQAGAWSGLDRGFDVVYEPGAFAPVSDGSTLTSTAITPELDAFLAQHADTRLFAYVQSIDPHAPYLPREEDLRAIARATGPRTAGASVPQELRTQVERETLAYDAEVRNNDREIAALRERLAALGLDAALCLMVASDHGEQFGEHGRLRHRQGLYQEEVHVPWIVWRPGRVGAGQRVEAPVTQLDMAPTLLGLLDVPVPDAWQGRDLSSVLRGRTTRLVPAPLFLDNTDAPGKRRVGVVDWPYKLIAKVMAAGPPIPLEVYDLEADTGERDDLLADGATAPAGGPSPERWTRMLEGLAAYVEAQRATRRAAGPRDDVALDPAIQAQMEALGYLGDVHDDGDGR